MTNEPIIIKDLPAIPEDTFSIETSTDLPVPFVRVKGEIDIYSCPQLNKNLLAMIEEGHPHLILNLDHVNYVDSTGLGTIAHAARTLAEQKGHISVVCQNSQIKTLFHVSGLTRKNVDVFESEEDALKAT